MHWLWAGVITGGVSLLGFDGRCLAGLNSLAELEPVGLYFALVVSCPGMGVGSIVQSSPGLCWEGKPTLLCCVLVM